MCRIIFATIYYIYIYTYTHLRRTGHRMARRSEREFLSVRGCVLQRSRLLFIAVVVLENADTGAPRVYFQCARRRMNTTLLYAYFIYFLFFIEFQNTGQNDVFNNDKPHDEKWYFKKKPESDSFCDEIYSFS